MFRFSTKIWPQLRRKVIVVFFAVVVVVFMGGGGWWYFTSTVSQLIYMISAQCENFCSKFYSFFFQNCKDPDQLAPDGAFLSESNPIHTDFHLNDRYIHININNEISPLSRQ